MLETSLHPFLGVYQIPNQYTSEFKVPRFVFIMSLADRKIINLLTYSQGRVKRKLTAKCYKVRWFTHEMVPDEMKQCEIYLYQKPQALLKMT